jgi:hypothetical protein
MTTASLSPLPPHARALRNHRWETQIAAPNPRRERSWIVRSTGRFTEQTDARSWAEAWRKPGERARMTYYSATDGWRPHAIATLTDNGWEG